MSAASGSVIDRLRASRVVPVATIEDPSTAPVVVRALLAGGIACIEVTFRHPAAPAAIRAARTVDGVLVGAGTVLSVEQAELAFEAGADFAVAPGTNDSVLERCRSLGLPFFPGVATATEIERARSLGLSLVKVFPAAQLGGTGFLRAVSAVYPDVGLMPTGGVTVENLGEYLAVPAVVACGGSWLVRPELV
ncbi:MAG: bifunctional 4-hydroxy-2-oxoglutarate aldolase/2-dehydro-3-deoxy-phosphogluconate aldolase, partial [Actinobacteria bacterium]|nr:bifunctional 4-hydroxy-2-oxoglutarate aldolase/2-dehydro-3-deoxy-phosphogluconate aldolase [Actinomycetota bacterium]